jgi:hypothetical protein
MPKLKVLQLDFWMKYDDNWKERTKAHSSYCGPAIYNRDGWYLLGDNSWFEFNGNSFKTLGLSEAFKYQLRTYNTQPLTQEQVDEMRKIVNALPKSHHRVIDSLRDALQHDAQAKATRNIGKRVRKLAMKSNKRIKELTRNSQYETFQN